MQQMTDRRRKSHALRWAVVLGASSLIFADVVTAQRAQPPSNAAIEQLVEQLNADEAAQRDRAEEALFMLAPLESPVATERFLQQLPRPNNRMPPEVRLRLSRIRERIENEISEQALQPTKITLDAEAMPLDKVLEIIAGQTGNRLADYRQQFGQTADAKLLDLEFENKPFWPAIDQMLDQASLDLYPFSGEEALGVVEREQGTALRAEGASYAGAFRIAPINIVAQRNLRNPEQQGLRVELEIAWEPRLRPIVLSQPASELEIIADDGEVIAPANIEAVFDVEVSPGSHASELTIPLELPSRQVAEIKRFTGHLSALVPGSQAEFRFENLAEAERVEQQRGGVIVTLTRVRKSQALWEVHMQLRVESEEAGLESHRGWVFQNISYLETPEGEVMDHVGFETTMQSEREVGMAYLFEIPTEEIDGYTWVYQTPAGIVRLPVEYQLKNIPLP